MKEYYRVQADINLDAIYQNIENTRKIVKKETKIMAVIKTDGYGHGAVAVAKTIDSLVDAYAVAIVEEAAELRGHGITKPILILGYVPCQQYEEMLSYEEVMPAVFTLQMAEELNQAAIRKGKVAKIHIKLDTGMGRIGFLPGEESVKTVMKISQLSNVQIEGCFTHFAKADISDEASTWKQFQVFQDFVKKLTEKGLAIPVCHAANSAAIMELPEMNLNMVRSGISTYGLYPSEEVEKERLSLVPAMEIKAFVSYVKELEAGVEIGYGGTYTTSRKTKVATVPVGYGDGYPRSLSNQGRVLIRGKSAPILGRICMDQFMVDVTEIEGVTQGDAVTLVGSDGTQRIPVEEVADMAGSFHYEFICDVGKRIPRVYYRHGKKVGTMDFYENGKTGLFLQEELLGK